MKNQIRQDSNSEKSRKEIIHKDPEKYRSSVITQKMMHSEMQSPSPCIRNHNDMSESCHSNESKNLVRHRVNVDGNHTINIQISSSKDDVTRFCSSSGCKDKKHQFTRGNTIGSSLDFEINKSPTNSHRKTLVSTFKREACQFQNEDCISQTEDKFQNLMKMVGLIENDLNSSINKMKTSLLKSKIDIGTSDSKKFDEIHKKSKVMTDEEDFTSAQSQEDQHPLISEILQKSSIKKTLKEMETMFYSLINKVSHLQSAHLVENSPNTQQPMSKFPGLKLTFTKSDFSEAQAQNEESISKSQNPFFKYSESPRNILNHILIKEAFPCTEFDGDIKTGKVSYWHSINLRQNNVVTQIIHKTIGSKDFVSFLRENIVGRYNLIKTPWGQRLRIYADFTASGQDLRLIDSVMDSITENYSNTHTEASHDGKIMNKLLKEAELNILKSCNADPKTHSLITVGTGSTGAIEFIQKILGTYIPPKSAQIISNVLTLDEIKLELKKAQNLTLVIISGYEHHSNEITWRNQVCDLKIVPFNNEGYMDLDALNSMMDKYSKIYNRIICSFSAGSNVTGIRTNIKEVTSIVKNYNGLVFFDYAGIAPYVQIDMNSEIDGIYISPHKFLGGPGTPGIAIIKNRVYSSDLMPTHGGGGTVDYVNPEQVVYSKNIMEREKSGTPGILQTIKASFAFMIKDMVFPYIHKREQEVLNKFFSNFGTNSGVLILGPAETKNRVNIVSFNIKHKDSSDNRLLHPAFVVRLLSDLFGIQARSGCSCASTYGHQLLAIEKSISEKMLKWVEASEKFSSSFAGIKPGWARINLHYSMNDDDVTYIIGALKFIEYHGHLFLKYYLFDPRNGNWKHLNEKFDTKFNKLSLNLLLIDKNYAKDENARSRLMIKHLDEAQALAEETEKNFALDPLLLWEDAAYFYAAEGNVRFQDLIEDKYESIKQNKTSFNEL
jgi:selenocysteine lyase/cysteine desulfurase